MAEAKTAAARGYDWPDEGELVVCSVTNVKNFGAFVSGLASRSTNAGRSSGTTSSIPSAPYIERSKRA
jgi:phage baseplate assembly protein gpV